MSKIQCESLNGKVILTVQNITVAQASYVLPWDYYHMVILVLNSILWKHLYNERRNMISLV